MAGGERRAVKLHDPCDTCLGYLFRGAYTGTGPFYSCADTSEVSLPLLWVKLPWPELPGGPPLPSTWCAGQTLNRATVFILIL